ncbi:Ubiquinol-cytochrome C reductase, cytochrome C1 subunit [hydrothermal vent metagenome]|uniref:Ubiquinol-cytochrome C reductase, cytochrome C1 subunit n=1 Tax=hydrothermal vent metagenome TaxID=652676 RepID=A0A3B0UT40_9ZZZZ
MIKKMNFLKAVLLAWTLGLSVAPAALAEANKVPAVQQNWSFSGVFGTYDTNQLQRGFQVFKEVCAACHSANQLAFRNLSEPGGPSFPVDQVKAMAAEYFVRDPDAPDGERPATLADRWPSPYATEKEARDAEGGALPPDFSVLAKARGIKQAFPFWVFNYFTPYQEGGADYIYNLMLNFTDPPKDAEVMDGQSYNAFFGGGLAMPPPLSDGIVEYQDPNVPQTVDQYAKDVSAFMYWLSDPHLETRKQIGFRVLIFLVVFAGLMYMVKRRLWSDVAH